MTILEKKSNRKKLAILSLVKKGEYSISYALMLTEQLSDEGKLIDSDYEELAEHLESLLNEENETVEEIVEEIENTEAVEEPVESTETEATEVVENTVESEEA